MKVLIGVPALLAMLASGVLAPPASAAEGTILDAGSASVVKDSYVVVLKSSTLVPAAATNLRGKYGGTVRRTYRHALGGFEISMGASAARRLAADPAVSFVQKNGIFKINETESNPPTGLDRIDQRALPLDSSYTFNSTAANVHAYIIDTGIRMTHQEFGGRAVSGTDTVDNDGDASDCNGHGTHVAGTVGGSTFGVAKGVQLVGVRVLNCTGEGTTAEVVSGIDWVTANAVKPAVANLSLGGAADPALDAAVSRSIASGVSYAVASGNEGADACGSSPARIPAALTVNATTTETDARASFSNFGTCTDVFAPGVDIQSAWFTSDTATNTISGTSMAAPHAAGAAALVLADFPGATPAQVADAITFAATPNVVSDPGAGSPNRLLFTATGTGNGSTPPAVAPPVKPSDPADPADPADPEGGFFGDLLDLLF